MPASAAKNFRNLKAGPLPPIRKASPPASESARAARSRRERRRQNFRRLKRRAATSDLEQKNYFTRRCAADRNGSGRNKRPSSARQRLQAYFVKAARTWL